MIDGENVKPQGLLISCSIWNKIRFFCGIGTVKIFYGFLIKMWTDRSQVDLTTNFHVC